MAFAASVGEAILLQFQAYAEQAVEKGADVGDAAYEQLLDGLQAAAVPARGFVMAQLLSWREGLLAGLRKQNDAITQRKRAGHINAAPAALPPQPCGSWQQQPAAAHSGARDRTQ
ncbi:hypothetical protein D9Q98_001436 [Chlorella vulgaris]|uniref:Uncharacterized protein n=1 Tax=Chlorella vulgaris TaxID=3077 RepID=A0A9D4U014_CHLVU|nr:hypothetical protein D9Q98_001436 [Chlorella vulgaris]